MTENESVVPIDETVLVKRNYEKGRELSKESRLLISGVDTSTKEAFMTLVFDRTKATIKQVLKDWVALDTIIHINK